MTTVLPRPLPSFFATHFRPYWVAALFLCLLCAGSVQAQTQIESALTATEPSGVTSYSVGGKTANFDGQNLLLLTFDIAGDTYSRVDVFTDVFNRRHDPASPSSAEIARGYPFGDKATVWYQGTCTSGCATASIGSSPFNTEEGSITNRYLDQGSDNTFDNGRGNPIENNNIERIDLVFNAGLTINNDFMLDYSGFPVFERSGGNSFGLAAITSIDGSNNPTGFDADGNGTHNDIVTVSNNSGNALTTAFSFVNFRGTNGTNLEPYNSGTNQSVKGVFVTLRELGLSLGQTFYGYSLFGPDIDSNYDLRDHTTFPTDTEGGADIIAAGNYFSLGGELPVELTSFDAQLDGKSTMLTWTTASETNNAGFNIEHKAAAAHDWTTLQWIDGHGTTEAEQAYSFRADNLAPGRHSFRLKQIDYDGTFDYSPEVEVIVELAERFVMEAAYPNPFNPQATMRFAVNRHQTVEVAMYDMLGRRVQVLWSGEAEAGRLQEVQIDGSGLPSGVYLVRAIGNGFMETQRVTLIK